MTQKNCLVLGDINIDIALKTNAYPPEGGMAHAEQADFRLGGSGCLTAVALHTLGFPAILSGNLGGDMFADFAMQHFRSAEMDNALICQLPEQQTGFFITLETPEGGMTTFGSRGANDVVLPEQQIIDRLKEFDHLHVSGYTLKGDKQYEVVKHLIMCAREMGLTTSLDPGVCISRQAREKVLRLLIHINYFLPNVDELNHLAGNLTLDEQVEFMLEQGCEAVIVKMGEKGSRYIDHDLAVHQPACRDPHKPIINTTGAGDCFNAGFLSGVLSGSSLKIALQAGNALAFRMITSLRGIQDIIADES